MGILKRFRDIMSANINALLDKAEDPEKMIDQYMRDLQEDLRNVKSETATIMAEEQRCKRQLAECDAEIAKMQNYAEKALLAGNEGDAMKFLEKKNQLVQKQVPLQQAYDVAAANSAKMKQLHDKLTKDMNDLNARRDAIKAKVQIAKTQEKMNNMMGSVADTAGSMAAFDRMEAKADAMLDKASAMSELNSVGTDSIDDLASKYDAAPSADVQDELAALKAKMGIQ
ncbi:MAG: PspA/IM30 family protein [Coprococcus sp.]|nr:PspA/IM30 family protein [Coprococcus sp.]